MKRALDIMSDLHAAGLTVDLRPGGRLWITPAGRLTDPLRELIRANKPALLDWLATVPAANDAGAPVQGGGEPPSHPAPSTHPLDTLPAGYRWCWPAAPGAGAPMSADEVRTFTARALLFMRRGLTGGQADALAGKLKTRDREGDTRRVCLECQRLTGARTCTAWQRARIGSDRPGDLLDTPQRCPAFVPAPIDEGVTPRSTIPIPERKNRDTSYDPPR